MRILADSCAWSLLLRRKNKAALSKEEQRMVASLGEAIQDGRVAIVGPIRQEVLSGIKEIAQFERLRSALEAFPDEPLTTGHYEEAARLFNLCRSHGVECGAIDILLCAVASKERWSILTTDGGMKRCMEVLKAEGFL
ncbi:MAG: PIN domain-containing protein [Terracidiphilus sp.]